MTSGLKAIESEATQLEAAGGRREYPDYRPCSVPWIPRVPTHWETWKLTHAFGVIGSGTTPRTDSEEFYGGEMPWVTTSELRERVIAATSKSVSDAALRAFPSLRVYPRGTLLFAMYGATIGRLGLLGVDATVNQACCALAYPKALDAKFAFYWLLGRRPILLAASTGGGQPNLSQDDLKTVRIPAPPVEEQQQIASFLDRETAKIDELVAKKRRLIELLKEKRTALISHAVTKGLDPDAEMKDSGVEWLSTVPEHWKIKRLKFLCGTLRKGVQMGPFGGMLKDLDESDTGYKVYGQENVISGDFGRGSRWIDEDRYRGLLHYKAKPEDVLLTRKGSIGHARVAPAGLQEGIIDSDTIRVRPEEVTTEFLVTVLREAWYAQEQIQATRRGAILSGLNTSTIENLVICVPPKPEQDAIARLIGEAADDISRLMARVADGIEALVEYRSALISAAVTGKIDVRAYA